MTYVLSRLKTSAFILHQSAKTFNSDWHNCVVFLGDRLNRNLKKGSSFCEDRDK